MLPQITVSIPMKLTVGIHNIIDDDDNDDDGRSGLVVGRPTAVREDPGSNLVCPMTTALTPTELKRAGRIKPPIGISKTPPTRLSTAEDHQESRPVALLLL